MQKLEKKVSAVLVAAGSSTRMGFDKLSFDLGGETVVQRSIRAFAECPLVSEIVLVAGKNREFLEQQAAACTKPVQVVQGGATRAESAKNGVLAAIMPQESVELLWKLLDEEPGREMTVSLEDRTVTCGDVTLPFEVNDYTRWRLMNGYDDIDLTLQYEDDIVAYEKMRAEKFPFKPKTLPVKCEPEQTIASAREGEYPDWQGPLADRGII